MITKRFIAGAKCSFVASCAVPLLILACNYHLFFLRGGTREAFLSGLSTAVTQLAPGMILLVVLMVMFWRVSTKYRAALVASAESQADFLENLSPRTIDYAIITSAGLSLFIELAIIRWQVSIFPLLAFYKNFALLACFAGLGLGYALAGRSQIPLILVIPLLAWQIIFEMVLKYGLAADQFTGVIAAPVVEQLHMGIIAARTTFQYGVIYFTLATLFLLTALALIPIGQLCGRTMSRTSNLRAYGFNLLGSLIGVLLMMFLSFLWTPP